MTTEDILESREFEELYIKHRKCLVYDSDNRVTDVETAHRMTLGYSKALKVIQHAEIDSNKIVMNIFSGAGGLLRVLSIYHPRLLIGIDKLYGTNDSGKDWKYAAEEAFLSWESDIQRRFHGFIIRKPLFYQYDVHQQDSTFLHSIDTIIIDPPYGVVSREVLGINEFEAKMTFFASVEKAISYLNPKGGTIVCVFPRNWMSELKDLYEEQNFRIAEELNDRLDLIIAKIRC